MKFFITLTLFFGIVLPKYSNSQINATFKLYNEDSGIFNEEIYNITSNEDGIIFFNSSTGAEYYDGSKFYKFKDVQENIFNKFPRISYSNNHLFFNTLSEVYSYDGNKYNLFFKNFNKGPISFLTFSKNGYFAVYSINTKIFVRSVLLPSLFLEIYDSKKTDMTYKNFCFKNDGSILVSSTEGLLHINRKNVTKISDKISFKTFTNEKNKLTFNVTENEIQIFNFKNNLIKKIDYRLDLFQKLEIIPEEIKLYSYYINEHIYIYSPLLNHRSIESKDSTSLNFINSSKNIYDIFIGENNNLTIKQIIIPENIVNPTYFYANNNKEVWVSSLNGLCKINIDNIIPNSKFINTSSSINNIISNGYDILISDNFLNLQKIDSSGKLQIIKGASKIKNDLKLDFTESSYCLCFDKNKNLYLGTIDQGVILIDSNYNINYLNENLYSFDKVCMAITCDTFGNIFSGGYDKIIKIDSNKNISYIHHPLLSKKFIYSIQKIDSLLFIFSDNNVLVYRNDSLYDFSTQLKIFNTNFSNIAKFKGKYILTSFNNGVFIISKNKENIWEVEQHFNKNDGLVSNEYLNVKVDKEYKIWLLTPHSIDIIKQVKDEYKILSLKNNIELKNEYYSESAFFIDSNDILYFGGKNGVTIFDTKKILIDSVNNSIVNINSIYINDEKYLSKDKNFRYTLNEIVINPQFKYYQNNIKFEFGAVDFSDNKLIYQYYLEGLEKEWNTTTKENSVNYRNLSPNNYTFNIRYWVNGNWSKTTHYSFTIIAPWWKNKLAYFIYILIVVVSIYVFIKNKIKQLSKKQIEKIKELERKNEFLNLQSSALLNQLKPHFIFNALAPLQKYIYTSNKDNAIKYLQTFSNLVRNMINHSREPFVSIKSELDFISQYLTQQQIEKNDSFSFEITNTTSETYFIPSLMIQPILENTIQYGLSDNEKGIIKIKFELYNQNYILIKINENGEGFSLKDKISQHSHRALNIIYDKINLYKEFPESTLSNISTSFENNLFTITLILPLKHED